MAKGIFNQGLIDGLSVFQDKVDMAVMMYAETAAKQMEGDAKENAKWVDRTGHARQRITGTVERYSKGYKIKLAHGVDYGLWLELIQEKKYAIIEPTIRLTGTFVVMPGFEGLLEKIGKGRK